MILDQFRAWQRGVMPSSSGGGYGGQNPLLLEAFRRLEAVEMKTEREREHRATHGLGAESPKAFQARIQRELGG